MLIFNLANTHSYLTPLKPWLWHIKSLVHPGFGRKASSTKAAWQSAKISTSSYESPCNSFMVWLRVRSLGIRSKQLLSPVPIVGDAGITVATEGCSEPVLPCLFSFCSAFWLPYILCGQPEYRSGEASQWTLQSHFLRWLTPGDIVKLEEFKWLHWGLGNGYYISCLDVKWPAMTMHWNMRTIASNLLANLLHPRQLWESL